VEYLLGGLARCLLRLENLGLARRLLEWLGRALGCRPRRGRRRLNNLRQALRLRRRLEHLHGALDLRLHESRRRRARRLALRTEYLRFHRPRRFTLRVRSLRAEQRRGARRRGTEIFSCRPGEMRRGFMRNDGFGQAAPV
jgi:hypothetical protein